MRNLRVKSAMRQGAGDCLCRAGADCLESSQNLKGGRAAEAGMTPALRARGGGAVDAVPGRAAGGPHGADGG